MKEKKLPQPEYLSRRLLNILSSGEYQIVKRARIGKSRKVWGLHDDIRYRLLVRKGLSLNEERRTLIHEGIHALYPPELHPHATEEAVEERTLAVDNHIGFRRKRRFESFLPPD